VSNLTQTPVAASIATLAAIATVPKQYEMMKIGGAALSFSLPVPASIEDYDRLAGKPGAALEAAVDNVVYRAGSCLPELRYQFVTELEKRLLQEFPEHAEQLKRKTKTNGKTRAGEEKIVFAEAEAEYVRRVLPIVASLRNLDEVPITEFQFIVDSVMEMEDLKEDGTPNTDDAGNLIGKLVRFDPSPRDMGPREPKVLPKTYKAAGDAIVASGRADAWLEKYGVKFIAPEDADEQKLNTLKAEAVGWKIKALEDAERAKVNLAGKYE